MNQIDLQGRIAVITGGAQGIGYACAQRMLRSGARVVLWDIDAARLEAALPGTFGDRPDPPARWSNSPTIWPSPEPRPT